MDANPGIRMGSSSFTDLVYADDTTLFATSSLIITTVDDVAKLQGAINLITDWAREWQLQVSVHKCSLLNIGHVMLPITSMALHCPISHTVGTLE